MFWTDDMNRRCDRLLDKEEKGELTPAESEELGTLLHTYDEYIDLWDYGEEAILCS